MAENTTLSAVISSATERGEFINGALQVVVKRGYPAEGNRPSKATVFDPANGQEAKLAWFAGDLRDFENKVVEVSGRGNKASLYRGKVEVSIGKEGQLVMIGPYSKGGGAAPDPGRNAGGGSAGGAAPKAAASTVDPTVYFHREMAKLALTYQHAFQYGINVRENLKKIGVEITPEHFQGCVSSLNIQANINGLNARVPKLREMAGGLPVKFLPPEPDPAEEERKRAAKEEAERIAREAEEARKRAEAARHPQENLDEDVPF